MNDLEKLKSAIATARRVHDRMTGPADGQAMINGTLIEAVELLAKALRAPGQPTPEQPTTKACEFDEGLVERLAVVVGDNGGESLSSAKMERIAVAVLAELAKAPVELPSAELIAVTFAGNDWSVNDLRCAQTAIDAIRSRIAPAIAARDAEIARQSERIADLEKRLTQKEREHSITIEKAADHAKRAADLEKRLAEQTSVDASGKTPGQVLYEAEVESEDPSFLNGPWWDKDDSFKRRYESLAQSVIRAFGGKTLVKPLEELATYWENGAKHDAMHVDYRVALRDCAKELREELAKLGVK